MGQFKTEPKMKTTEPSVELKLKKGGKAKMADGGIPPVERRMAAAPIARAMTDRAVATAPARPIARPVSRPVMQTGALTGLARKKGGEVSNSKLNKEIRNESEEIGRVKARLTKHEDTAASKAHKGLKTGGVVNGQGGYKTGGVVNGQGGYKKGGLAKSGIIKNEAGAKHSTKMVQAKQVKRTNTKTGAIKQGPAGYKDGGFVEHSKSMSKHSCGYKVGGKMSSC